MKFISITLASLETNYVHKRLNTRKSGECCVNSELMSFTEIPLKGSFTVSESERKNEFITFFIFVIANVNINLHSL